jgi:glycosyltransferase involved in cell wall biosynthesis
MRVLHLIKTSSGATWALRQVTELKHAGVDCHVVLPTNSGMAHDYARAGIMPHFLDLNVRPWRGKCGPTLDRLTDLVAELRPSIVHSHFVQTTLLMRYALRRDPCPRVFQVPGPLHLENPLTARIDVMTAQSQDYWIASCRWTQQRYRQLGVPAHRVFLAHYGCDVEATQPAPPGTLRRELGIADETSLVGMVAYCYKPKRYLGARRGIKGHEDFIDAIALLRRGGVKVVGVIAGGPWDGGEAYFHRVRRYAERNADARIVFLGHRRDVPEIYADLTVAVHPSLSENLGGAGESLLCGVPTVTTNVGGFPDLILQGKTGLMVQPRSPGQLAAAIGTLLRNPEEAQRLAHAGRAHARELLDIRVTARAVQGIYDDILGSAHKETSGRAMLRSAHATRQ